MNVQEQVASKSGRPEVATLWARLLFVHCDDLVFVALQLKDLVGPGWVGMFETFRDAFDYAVQRGFIPAENLWMGRQQILGPERPAFKSEWIPFSKKLTEGMIRGYVDFEH